MIFLQTEIQPQTQKTNIWIPRRKGGWDELGGWDWHMYTIDTIYKTDN